MNKSYKIALLPGDGIGPEVCDEAVKVLHKCEDKFGFKFEITPGLIGGAAWPVHGNHFPQETKTLCLNSDAVLFGSVGGPVDAQFEPRWKDCERNSILAIRQFLKLKINLRPAPIYKELLHFCPLKKEIIGEKSFEILVIRELSEGIYFGEHSRPEENMARDVAEYHVETVEKVARFAFEAAQKRRNKVSSIDKANVLETSRLWREVFERVAKDFPDVEFENVLIDNAVQWLVKNPRHFDVLACPNLFGDIVSDLTSVFSGSLGMLGSASLGDKTHLYEPSGGSAPKLTGLGTANPIAQILSAAMMLRFSFAEHKAADSIENAIKQVIAEGYRTADLYSGAQGETKVGTAEIGNHICENIS